MYPTSTSSLSVFSSVNGAQNTTAVDEISTTCEVRLLPLAPDGICVLAMPASVSREASDFLCGRTAVYRWYWRTIYYIPRRCQTIPGRLRRTIAILCISFVHIGWSPELGRRPRLSLRHRHRRRARPCPAGSGVGVGVGCILGSRWRRKRRCLAGTCGPSLRPCSAGS